MHLCIVDVVIFLAYVAQDGIDQPRCGSSREDACATLDYLLALDRDPDVLTSQVAQSKQIITDTSINASQLAMVCTICVKFY